MGLDPAKTIDQIARGVADTVADAVAEFHAPLTPREAAIVRAAALALLVALHAIEDASG